MLTDAAGQKLSKSQQLPVEAGILGQVQGKQAVLRAVAELLKLPVAAAETLETLQQGFGQLGLPHRTSFLNCSAQ